MKRRSNRLSALVALTLVTLGACSRHKDPTLTNRQKDEALQTALDELTRLNSFTEAGLNYQEYSDRLLTVKGNIEVALQRTTDEPAKNKIREALSYYVEAREEWKSTIENKDHRGPSVQYLWYEGAQATKIAMDFAFVGGRARQEIAAKEQAARRAGSACRGTERKAGERVSRSGTSPKRAVRETIAG